MPRPLSPFIQNLFAEAELLNARAYNTLVGFDITLTSGAKLYLGTGTFLMSSVSKNAVSVTLSNPIAFEGRLQSVPDLRFSTDETADNATVSAVNLDWALTQLIPSEQRYFDNAEVKMYLCFPKSNGTFEGLQIATGIVRNIAGDGEDASFNLLSDISDPRATVGLPLTQKCLHELGSPGCGATNLAPGSICSKDFYDDVSGCAFYGQQHAHSGCPFINPIAISGDIFNDGVIAGGGISGGYDLGGGGGGSGWLEPSTGGWGGCVDPKAWILLPENKFARAGFIRPGTETIDHLGRVGVLENVERKRVDYRYLLTTDVGARLICSADHPLLTSLEDLTGKPAIALNDERAENRMPLVVVINGVTKLCNEYRFQPMGAGEVIKLTISAPHLYGAGMQKNAVIMGHNLKPMYTGLEIYENVRMM